MKNLQTIKSFLKRCDLLVFFVIIVLPIALIFACWSYAQEYGLGKFEIISAIVAYYISNISVGIGLHRLWAHGAYKAHPILSKILVISSAFCLQGSILKWASDHKRHHAYADTENDPHTPATFPDSKLKGFLWSHLGWMIIDSPLSAPVDEGTLRTIGRDTWIRLQHKFYAPLAIFLNVPFPALIGYMCGGTWHYAYAALIFIGLGRALQQQMTFCVNSVCHMMGKREYADDTSGDIAFLWPFLLGENWHNFHHAFGSDYRCGHKWYHFDVHKWIIWGLSKVGLAKNLVVTSVERISAKENEIKTLATSEASSILLRLETATQSLLDQIKSNVQELRQDFNNSTSGMGLSIEKTGRRFSSAIDSLSDRLVELRVSVLRELRNLEINASIISQKIAQSSLAEFERLSRKANELGISVLSTAANAANATKKSKA